MTVSVIIPFYNLKDYVRPALESVAGVSVPPGVELEVICVDDGSTDGTSGRLDEFVASGSSPSGFAFRVLHKSNGGEGSARNAGLAEAHGEWVTFLDGDDLWLRPMLTEFVSVRSRHPDADVIGFRFLPFDDGAAVPEPVVSPTESEYDIRREIPSEAIFDLGVFPTFFRREKVSGIAFSALPLGADRLYVAECLARAECIVMSASAVHGYRVREGSMARAVWNERKIKSMVDFASGSRRVLRAAGKRIGRAGDAYLADVLISVAPRQLRRMEGDATSARRHWLGVLSEMDVSALSFWRRLKRRWQLIRFR